LVADSQDFAWHAGRSEVDATDMELASDMREDAGPIADALPPRHQVMAMAEELNRIPLPPIPSYCYSGIALPPQEQQLTARTFDVVSSTAAITNKRVLVSAGAENDEDEDENNKSAAGEPSASYGANKSKRISVSLKSQEKEGASTTQQQSSAALTAGVEKEGGLPNKETAEMIAAKKTSGVTLMDIDEKDESDAAGLKRKAGML
jgi:hypothetical protein